MLLSNSRLRRSSSVRSATLWFIPVNPQDSPLLYDSPTEGTIALTKDAQKEPFSNNPANFTYARGKQ